MSETQKMVLERGPNVRHYPSYERYIGPFKDDQQAEVYVEGRRAVDRGRHWSKRPWFYPVDLVAPAGVVERVCA